MHHQFRHRRPTVVPAGQIQIADDFLAAGTRVGTGGQQVVGAVVRQLPQNLLTDGCHQIKFGCRSDEFANLLLLVGV
jgi:hypothetical protein